MKIKKIKKMNVENRIQELEENMSQAFIALKSLKDFVRSQEKVNDVLKTTLLNISESLNSFNDRVLELEDSAVNGIKFNTVQNDINTSNQRMFSEITSFISETNEDINTLYAAVSNLSS